MRKYDSYKDSGIEWIGEIPSHWETKRIRHIADIFGRIGYRGYTVEDIVFDESGAISLSPSNIENQKLTLESVTRITQEKYEESPEIMVFENDVVLVKTASVGKAAIVRPLNDLATINPQLVVFKNYRIDQTFFYYEIISRIIQDQITQDLNGGVVNTITQTNLNNYSIIVPQPQEQTAIAAYLDRKTAEIDELIADKKRLLELYEEEKTALINQAVTKGINPDVPMKDSGIEWLGDIPEHWEVKRLKYVISQKLMYGANESAEEEIKDNPRYIRITDFGNDGKLKDDTFKSLSPEKANDYLLADGDILFARSGATVGKTFQFKNYEGSACFAGYLIKATPNPKVLESDFLYYFTKSGSYENWKCSIFNQATIQNIGADKYAFLELPLPQNLQEQQAIVCHIETGCARIDAKKVKTEKLIELLTEYRTALISEVVTGKVKVIE